MGIPLVADGDTVPAYRGTLKEVAGVLASWAMGCLGHPTE
jgi:hypothetical protein